MSSNSDVTATAEANTTNHSSSDLDSQSDDEHYVNKLDDDVGSILRLEQSHISHVGVMDTLRHFYLAHNPRLLQSPQFVENLMAMFEGREKQLFEKLKEAYRTDVHMAYSDLHGHASINFLSNITMESLLYRKPTRGGVRGKVQEIMAPHPHWFELCGCLLVWSKGFVVCLTLIEGTRLSLEAWFLTLLTGTY